MPLQGRSADEVAAVVADSKLDSHVELVVSRPLAAIRPPAQPWRTHKGHLLEGIGQHLLNTFIHLLFSHH